MKNNAMIYDFTITTGTGETLCLADYKGKVILIVNTATGCGFTPQYAPIEQLYKDYHDKGLEILDIPCNQFGGQAPGSDEEIHAFCTLHFNTTFPQMRKADVNGPDELPLYTWLKSQKGFAGFGDHPKAGRIEFLQLGHVDFVRLIDVLHHLGHDGLGDRIDRFLAAGTCQTGHEDE